jgi:hypothetical protein
MGKKLGRRDYLRHPCFQRRSFEMTGCINTPLRSKEDPAVSDQAHSAEAINAIQPLTQRTLWLALPPRFQGRTRQPEPMPYADLSSSQACLHIRSKAAASTETAFADLGHAVDLDLHEPVADSRHAGDCVPCSRSDQAHRTDPSDMSPRIIYEPTRRMSVNSLLVPPTRFQRRKRNQGRMQTASDNLISFEEIYVLPAREDSAI